jgi:maltooligosyltrehalose trehalohydrolase
MTADAFRQRLSFGAELAENGATEFRIWAPSAPIAPEVVFADRPAVPMRPEEHGWFTASAAAPAGTAYRFRVTPDQLVPDPASRAQQDDVHGWSLVFDPAAYRWRNAGWTGRPWRETVLYELHVGAFAGNFSGVEAELDRLAALGVTAIELMPVAEFPGTRNWGYDGVLPFAVERSYGGPDALKHLVDAAHGHGLMVFLDVVYNHFGPDGNYLHLYAAPFFAPDAQTPWGASIDFRQAAVRQFFIENALYWLQEFRIDGLRFDAAHAIDDAPGEGFLAELATHVRAEVGTERHVHLVLEHDGNAANLLAPGLYNAQWNDDAHHALHVMLTGERDGYYADYTDDPARHLARCLGQGFAYQGESSPHRGGAVRGVASAHLPPSSFVLFLQNHDQIGNRAHGDRRIGAVDPAARRAALALLLLAPGIPMLFMGDEWATERPFLYFTAHHGELAMAVREGRRREFARFAAFDSTELADPNDPATFALSRLNAGDERSAYQIDEFAYHRQLLALRRTHIVPRLDSAVSLGADAVGPTAVRATWRLGDGCVLQALCNLGPDAVRVPAFRSGKLLFVTDADVAANLTQGWLRETATAWQVLSEAP